jgi:CHAD domain-containing protein
MAGIVRAIELKYDQAAAPPAVTGRSSAAEVVLAYLREQVLSIARHDPLVRRDEPDAVHQMRVAARRARSTLQAFGAVVDREATRPLTEELRWLGITLGQARDCEVMRDRLTGELTAIAPALVTGPVAERLATHFAAELDQAGKVSLAALDGPRYQRLLADLDALVTRPPLTARADRGAGKALRKPVRRTGRRLARALAAVPAADDHDAALHEARKAAKRARYAAEAAAPALGAAASRQAAQAKDLQQLLGDQHDSVVARTVLLDLAAAARDAGEDTFAYGLLYQRQACAATAIEQSLPSFTTANPHQETQQGVGSTGRMIAGNGGAHSAGRLWAAGSSFRR